MENSDWATFEVVTVDATGQPIARQQMQAPCQTEELAEAVALRLVAVPGGSFVMGAPRTEAGCAKSQIPQRSVELSPFWLGQHPVTQAQWQAVAALPKVNLGLTAAITGEAALPMTQVTWLEAVEFCDRLSQHSGRSYRLPSEAEWEYACRAGTPTPFHFGETITTELANYSGVNWDYEGKIRSRGAYGQAPLGLDRRTATPIGFFGVANAFGLSDMHGNVREWCLDRWHEDYAHAPIDGSAWLTEGDPAQRVVRGGSWNTSPNACRSAFRGRFAEQAGLYDIGFRVARSV